MLVSVSCVSRILSYIYAYASNVSFNLKERLADTIKFNKPGSKDCGHLRCPQSVSQFGGDLRNIVKDIRFITSLRKSV